MDKLKRYLNESRVSKDLTAHVTNKVNEAIEEWKKENLDELGYWPTRAEDLERLADEMVDFFRGMKRSAKQEKRR